MTDRIAQVLADQMDAIRVGVAARLSDRGEFAGNLPQLQADVALLAQALGATLSEDQPALLTEAALALGRDDGDPCRGYGRVQLLLDVLCSESVEALRRVITGPDGKEASARLRAMLGPAMLGLADLCRTGGETAPTPES